MEMLFRPPLLQIVFIMIFVAAVAVIAMVNRGPSVSQSDYLARDPLRRDCIGGCAENANR